MGKTVLYEKDKLVSSVVIDNCCFKGVERIANVFAQDHALVTGVKPCVSKLDAAKFADSASKFKIVFATLGKSEILPMLADKAGFDLKKIEGKREVFCLFISGNNLVAAGSDLRGTIYGIFEVSRLFGVSPLVYWGDVVPEKKDKVEVDLTNGFISKEPSITYRGFFINDEWPAFGNWCLDHFGGFTVGAYEQVFLLLLRLRGNYMWPAMWSSTFSEDGPGLANAELANELGIIMGASHHEPMCRAGAEWQHIYSQYCDDNTWSFISNTDAITRFWKDGIIRNKDFRNIITIGMRGENDSKLLGANATLKDNIDVIKSAITTQRKLISEVFGCDPDDVPQMLAIYKEVEDYYYGNKDTAGLREWEELKNVIFMLCEDNFGNTRGLPEKSDLEKHPGGFGMYYHFDYHGAPISYEWQNCVRLTKTCDQLTNAYDHGVRKLWIVNVGDIKGVEYPLEYFMDLAYDYETWSNIDLVEDYVSRFVDEQFGYAISASDKKDLLELIDGFTKWSTVRKIEAVSPSTYHAAHYGEASYVINECNKYIGIANKLQKSLRDDIRVGYDSMFYYPALAELNVIRLNAYASLNEHFFKAGSKEADMYAEYLDRCIAYDKKIVDIYNKQLNGKWDHMMQSAHVWFKTWCDQGWSYPEAKYLCEDNRYAVNGDPSLDELDMSGTVLSERSCEGSSFEYIGINAEDYVVRACPGGAFYKAVKHLGRLGSAIKAYPQNVYFNEENAPSVTYSFTVPSDGMYDIYFSFMARNPVVKGAPMRIRYSVNDGQKSILDIVDETYYTEWMNKDWNEGVMTGVRIRKSTVALNEGENELTLFAYDPNVVIEKFMIVKENTFIPQSYLGPRW